MTGEKVRGKVATGGKKTREASLENRSHRKAWGQGLVKGDVGLRKRARSKKWEDSLKEDR